MYNKLSFIIVVLLFASYIDCLAQKNEVYVKQRSIEEVPAFVVFEKESSISGEVQLEKLFVQILKSNQDDELRETSSTVDELGYEHIEHQQYFKGVKVEHGRYKVHFKEGTIKSANGEFYKVQVPTVIPRISPEVALAKLQQAIGAKSYMWESEEYCRESGYSIPKGELVILPILDRLKNTFGYRLTYKFDIYSAEPFDRAYYFIDAINEEIVKIEPRMCASNAETRYSETRQIYTESTSEGFRLYDHSRGNGIHVLNNNRQFFEHHALATDYYDADDNWTALEWANQSQDQAALDAFWGLERTYDFFLEKHGRNSYDGNGAKIIGYTDVNFGLFGGLNNVYWTGNDITFGYGDGVDFTPLTSIDICAHEIGHGICQHSANLIYSYESGALNEGLSDIWGACVESYAAPEKERWLLGEEVTLYQYALRDMANPNALKLPDTYLGDFWWTNSWDNGGVHFNSSVLNHWFYLLTDGSQDTDEINDNGDVFQVDGIGIDKAAKIAYRMETIYLTSNSEYADAREFGIQSAIDIFGECSEEHKATQNAFYAVGLGEKYCKPRSVEQETWMKRVRSIDYGSIVYNNSSGASPYSDYTTNCITSFNNQSQTISFLVNKEEKFLAIWFDANGNGEFENSSPELVFNEQIPGKHQIFRLIDITGIMANETGLLRVMISDEPIDNPCDDLRNGETEDYLVCSDGFCESQAPTNLRVENGVLVWDPIPGVLGYEITAYNGSDGPIPQCDCEIQVELFDVMVDQHEWEVPEEMQHGCFFWSVRANCSEEMYSEYSNYACYNGNDFEGDSGMSEDQYNNLSQALILNDVTSIVVFDVTGRLLYKGNPMDLSDTKMFYNGLIIIQHLNKDGNLIFTEKRIIIN